MKTMMCRLLPAACCVILTAGTLCAQQTAITIYNNDLALVKDARDLRFERGTFSMSFTDVAARIDPTSVFFTVIDAPDDVAILEQNYRYDLVGTERLIQKYIDRTIRIVTRKEQVHEGTLLAADAAAVTLQESGGGIRIVARDHIADLAFPELPEGLITRPTLTWLLDSRLDGKHPAEVRYLTNGINWHAEYVAVVAAAETSLELAGWVSIENNSGATYKDAKVKLIAGDVHRVTPPPGRLAKGAFAMEAGDRAGGGFEEKAFFEYHLYTLDRRATIADREIKQLSLFAPADVAARKLFVYNPDRDFKKVRVEMEFDNSAAAGLGMPLPKGKMRVMKADDDGSLEFIGEDMIDHTPKDEKVRVFLGNAFDITPETTRKDAKRISDRVREETWEIKLRNHKDEDVSVKVAKSLYGDWEILMSTHPATKKDARTAEFELDVPRDGETVLIFTVRIR